MKTLAKTLALVVLSAGAALPPAALAQENPDAPKATAVSATNRFSTEDGKYHFTIDTGAESDLTEWAGKQLAPVVTEWYPKIVKLLPSDGYDAPTNVTIRFREGMGGVPASAGSRQINCNIEWFRKNLKGEARGSVVHEMVHVVQSYGRVRKTDPGATRMPGWLIEGIPDYIRWFLYEPESRGAEITKRNIEKAKHDASYRVTGNFLNWVTLKHDKDLVRKLNAAAREGKYSPALWKDYTGKTVEELGAAWKKEHEERLGVVNAAAEPAKEPAAK